MTSAPDSKAIESALDQRPDSTRSFPAQGTQPARLLAALLERQRIDPLQGWIRLGIYRLSDAVLQLRRLGWSVQTSRKDVRNRFGEECHVADYSMVESDIVAAGEAGRQFIAAVREV